MLSIRSAWTAGRPRAGGDRKSTVCLYGGKKLFAFAGLPNIDQYNAETGADLHRLTFACDEVAEVLDQTGLNKEQKELVNQIESWLATIARLGRAFGIHLILATQRPDASLISGQIRNNLNCRIYGRADNILFQLILDNTDAANQIPKVLRGGLCSMTGQFFRDTCLMKKIFEQ